VRSLGVTVEGVWVRGTSPRTDRDESEGNEVEELRRGCIQHSRAAMAAGRVGAQATREAGGDAMTQGECRAGACSRY
jgi:hypothetical protein